MKKKRKKYPRPSMRERSIAASLSKGIGDWVMLYQCTVSKGYHKQELFHLRDLARRYWIEFVEPTRRRI